jgi:serine protease Do
LGCRHPVENDSRKTHELSARKLPGQNVNIYLSDGRDAAAVILGTNLVSDVGLLKITDEGPWPHAELGHSALMKPGDRCVLIGYPGERPGRRPWVSKAQIIRPTALRATKDEWSPQFWTSGNDSHLTGLGGGISGGGVFDLQGRVVGVVLGGNGIKGKQERRHARVELFRKQWDLLVASKSVNMLDSDPRAKVRDVFRGISEDLPPIAVEVLAEGMPRVLGTIIRSDGRILTKASELAGALSCRLADGRVFPASVQKVSQEHDLAILKIDATDLPEAQWSPNESIAPGTLIAALIPGQPPLAGLVSLASRPRPPAMGALGVIIENGDGGLKVHDGVDHGFNVPLRKGDVVVQVEGHPLTDYNAYLALFEPESGKAIANAGDTVRVGIQRGSDTLELRFTLPPSNFFTYHASEASRRWWGFPSVFDTDIRLTPKQCGGPVIDKSGHVIGIVIACQPGDNFPKFGQRHVIPASVARKVIGD